MDPTQLAVIARIAAGATISAAARAAEIHRSTIYNWLDDPAFARALESAREEFAAAFQDELHELTVLALKQLRLLLEDPATPPSIRLRAATAILNRPVPPKPAWTLPANRRRSTQIDTSAFFPDPTAETGGDLDAENYQTSLAGSVQASLLELARQNSTPSRQNGPPSGA